MSSQATDDINKRWQRRLRAVEWAPPPEVAAAAEARQQAAAQHQQHAGLHAGFAAQQLLLSPDRTPRTHAPPPAAAARSWTELPAGTLASARQPGYYPAIPLPPPSAHSPRHHQQQRRHSPRRHGGGPLPPAQDAVHAVPPQPEGGGYPMATRLLLDLVLTASAGGASTTYGAGCAGICAVCPRAPQPHAHSATSAGTTRWQSSRTGGPLRLR